MVHSTKMKQALKLSLSWALPVRVACVLVPASDTASVRVTGQFSRTTDGAILFDWPSVTLTASLRGTELAVVLSDTGNFYDVSIDEIPGSVLATTNRSEASYTLASGLAPSIHTVVLVKRTEGASPSMAATLGVVTLHGFTADGPGAQLPPPLSRRLLFLGDSISCGYGALGSGSCDAKRPELESSSVAFAARTAQSLQAEYHLLCASGKGVVRNYGGSRADWHRSTLPVMWRRALGSDPDSGDWNATSWTPHAIVVHLGTNDFSTPGAPSHSEFAESYRSFLSEVRRAHGGVPAVLACGPLCSRCPLCDYVEAISRSEASLAFADLRLQLSSPERGCDGHPSAAGAGRMAEVLAPVVAAAAGWPVPVSRASAARSPSLALVFAMLAAGCLLAGLPLCRCCRAAAEARAAGEGGPLLGGP